MAFPRFHITAVPVPFQAPVHSLTQRLHLPAVLGTVAGVAFATTGMLVNTAYFPANAAATAPSKAEIVSSLTSYINEWTPERDPLVTVPGVGEVKASNLQGVEVAGQRYYYRVLGGASFDPLSAGQAGRYETVAVLDQGTPWEVQIYQIAK